LIRRIHPRAVSRLRHAAQQGDWRTVSAMGRTLRRAWYIRAGPAVAARSEWHRLQRHLLPPAAAGLTVAILGPDGAGKTTLAKALVSSAALPARYIYLGVWQESRLEMRLRRVLGARLAVRLVRLTAKALLIHRRRRMGH